MREGERVQEMKDNGGGGEGSKNKKACWSAVDDSELGSNIELLLVLL